MHVIDLTGQKFNRWTVISRAENTPQGQARWNVVCTCDTKAVLNSIVIRRGISKSCGCWKIEGLKVRATTHGHTCNGKWSPTYMSWSGMYNRCTNQKDKSYHNYGGRGITICERWLTFENFLADMGERPSTAYQIDRINNDGNYEPANCRWADKFQQARNKRSNRVIEYNGCALCLNEWAEVLGIKRETLKVRLSHGWSIKEAFTTPVRPHKPYVNSRQV